MRSLLLLLLLSRYKRFITITITITISNSLTTLLITLMVGHGGSSAGSYLADPTPPIPSHCASIDATSTLRVNKLPVSGVQLGSHSPTSAHPFIHFIDYIDH